MHHASPTKASIAADCFILLADLQTGIADLPLTVPMPQLKRNVGALMKLAEIFELPVVISAVPSMDGGAPQVLPEITAHSRGAGIHLRTTPNSFANKDIIAAVNAIGRKTMLVSGVATEVAVQLPALTAAAQGFDVHVIIDACGGISPRTEDAALRRLTQAGVKISSLPTLAGELAGDFAEPKGQAAIGVLFELARA